MELTLDMRANDLINSEICSNDVDDVWIDLFPDFFAEMTRVDINASARNFNG